MIRALLIALALLGAGAGPAQGYGSRIDGRCHEDQACWNWRDMGNGKRGVVTIAGRKLTVNGRQYDRLRAGGWIDRDRTPRLRGDARG